MSIELRKREGERERGREGERERGREGERERGRECKTLSPFKRQFLLRKKCEVMFDFPFVRIAFVDGGL
jgi:hypothetical protein